MQKIVWLCSFSNEHIRNHIKLHIPWWESIARKLTGKQPYITIDFAQWNTNAVNTFNNSDYDVELTVICVHPYVKGGVQRFVEGKINYVVIDSLNSSLWNNLKNKVFHSRNDYKMNRRLIVKEIKSISPDIIHVIGAENLYYSLSVLDMPPKTPILIQLQTLLNDPALQKNPKYIESAVFEREVLKRTDYIGTTIKSFPHIIRGGINPDAIIVNSSLCVGETINLDKCEKQFDFVYFSANIDKASDLAIEAFILAHKKNPSLSLDIVGAYSEPLLNQLKERLFKEGVENAVVFEGRLPSHEDVIRQIRKARFALLPLKTDFISGTCREAMANGLPLLTTRTQGDVGTLLLNKDRQTALITEIGDHQALANNMLRLVNDPVLEKELQVAGATYIQEHYSNKHILDKWFELYPVLINHFHNNTPIPEFFLNKN